MWQAITRGLPFFHSRASLSVLWYTSCCILCSYSKVNLLERVTEMYVLIDMEWITNRHGNHWPTQLAASRVDEAWNTVDTFSVLFRPKDASFQDWNHMAFSGWDHQDFEDGESLYPGLDAFQKWLRPDDIICWWHQEANDLFNMFIKIRLHHAARLYSDEEN